MPEETIAEALGIPLDRLRTDFNRELRHGAAIIRAAQLTALAAAADAGNATAAKALFALGGSRAAAPNTHAGGAPESRVAARALRILQGGRNR